VAVTTLDPKTALIVVDLQAGIVALPTVHPIDGVIARAAELAAAFRKHDLPVVLVNVAGGAPGRNEQPPRASGFPPEAMEIVAALERAPGDHLVTKRTWGAFTNTDLDAYLKSHGVTNVVVCGVATSIGVESTARFAHELGYNVTLAIDAMTDMRPEAHDNSVQRIFPRLGETGTAQEIVALLAQSRS
jgi:nicotinamidase-related amidase